MRRESVPFVYFFNTYCGFLILLCEIIQLVSYRQLSRIWWQKNCLSSSCNEPNSFNTKTTLLCLKAFGCVWDIFWDNRNYCASCRKIFCHFISLSFWSQAHRVSRAALRAEIQNQREQKHDSILGLLDSCGYVLSMHASVFVCNWSSKEGWGIRCKINGSCKSNMPSTFL